MTKLPNTGLNYKNGGTIIKFVWHETLRRYSQPEVFAAFIGMLADSGLSNVTSGGSSYEGGACYPSKTHSNGFAIDTGYVMVLADDQKIIDGMKKFGFKKRVVGSTSYLNGLKNHSWRDPGSLHDTHLHCGGAPKNGIVNFKPNYK